MERALSLLSLIVDAGTAREKNSGVLTQTAGRDRLPLLRGLRTLRRVERLRPAVRPYPEPDFEPA